MAEDKSVFLNPYNFISFPQKKAEAYTDTDKHTGVIEYTITTKTPLFIPNSSSDKAFKESETVTDHKSYDFFSYTNLNPGKTYENEYHLPVIPGSEMRGVVRNAYETLTDSCMGLLNEEIYPVKRSYEKFIPGLLYKNKDKLVLYSAASYRVDIKISRKYKNGKKLYFTPQRATKEKKDKNGNVKTIRYWKIVTSVGENRGNYLKEGYLLKWGMGLIESEDKNNKNSDNKNFNNKNSNIKTNYHIYQAKKEEEISFFTREKVERKVVAVIDSYLAQPAITPENEKAYMEYKKDLVDFLNGNEEKYFPVNYSALDKENIYLAPAVYSKEIYNNSIGKLAGEFAPCKEDFCPACDLFGHIGKTNKTCKGSGIRFTDLYVKEEKTPESYNQYYLENKITLQTLGGPKLGNVEFYLKKPDKNASFWTYDYYILNWNVKVVPGELRGRKYYWHHPQVHFEKVEPTNLNKTVRPVKEGIEFKGKLYYESISKKQLEQLIWILNSGSEQLGLKLGAAKPLGLGSISCTVDQVQERKIKLAEDGLVYSVEKIPLENITYETVGFSQNVKEEFYLIAGLNTVSKNIPITYPRTYEQKNGKMEEGFKWFGLNHWIGKAGNGMIGNRKNVEILKTLPPIKTDKGLPYDPQVERKKQYWNSNHSGNGWNKDKNKR
nr:TIGR03986 family CRISPR-associated RAMP protein [uncultured Blautia sp.]